MKKLAARDFEDILQVTAPIHRGSRILTHTALTFQCAYFAFDGLLDDAAHNKVVMKMIFVFATWHALAKLRLHSDTTLDYFESMTKMLGNVIRAFVRHVCSAYVTKELPSETMSRQRRAAAKKNRSGAQSTTTATQAEPTGMWAYVIPSDLTFLT